MPMTKEQLGRVILSVTGLAHQLDAMNVTPFKDAMKRLTAALQPLLPEKADGTAYTDEELHAAAEEARKPFQEVLDRG